MSVPKCPLIVRICACLAASLPWAPPTFAQAAESPIVIPTFECLGLYWKAEDDGADKVCETLYREAGASAWNKALPLWFDSRNREYRGSIVGLRPATEYEVRLQLSGTTIQAATKIKTWSEVFPVARKAGCAPYSNHTLNIAASGTPEGFVLYEPESAASSVIDVESQADHCITISASYVIVRGLTLKGARVHAILLGPGVHDVVIEDCDISGWGRVAADGWGKDYDAAVYSKDRAVKRIIVQRNRIHHPRSNSNNWQQARPAPGKREPSHPEGPQAVCLWDSEGNHVIRYNTVFSDDDHQYNDIFGAGQNFSTRGFPNRDSDIYGNLLSHCWDDAIESEGANCNVRIWGNYIAEAFVGVAAASTSVGPLYVWRNVTGVIRESPTKTSGAFFKTSDRLGGGRIFVFHNTILQPPNPLDPPRSRGAVVGLGWGGPMTNVTSRNNILHVTRQAISDRAQDPSGDYDYDLFSAPLAAATNQEPHGIRGVPVYVPECGMKEGRGVFALAAQSPGHDAGVALPNFNDRFTGAAPDIGAHEAGSPPMEFGINAYRTNTRSQSGATVPEPKTISLTREQILDHIRGGWTGMLIGGIEGLAHEFKYIQQPREDLPDYELLPRGARSDDDNDFEWTHLYFMNREGVLKIPYPRLVEIWKSNMNTGIWCANEQARKLMDKGVIPPGTADPSVNRFAAFNLAGQFCVEAYGMIAPGMPRSAAELGLHYARVSVSGEPLQAAQYWTTLISLAAVSKETMEDLLRRALPAVNPASAQAEAVTEAIRAFHQYPTDWKAARRYFHEKWYFPKEKAWDAQARPPKWNDNSTPLNGAMVILALLYGQGDFYRTGQYAMALGYDADCNAATACAVIGTQLGYAALEKLPRFKMPDRYQNLTRPELPRESKVSEQAAIMVRLCEKLIVENGGQPTTIEGQPGYQILFQEPRCLAP